MEHIMFVQEVKQEKKDEYIGAHRDIWPELLTAIKESGIEREMIWMHGNYICIYMMSENFEKAMASLGEKQIFKDSVDKLASISKNARGIDADDIVPSLRQSDETTV